MRKMVLGTALCLFEKKSNLTKGTPKKRKTRWPAVDINCRKGTGKKRKDVPGQKVVGELSKTPQAISTVSEPSC